MPSQQRGQVRTATIMQAAAALFREKGFDAVTMSDIAARSGTAFGSLYRFFPSKEALANALLLQFAQLALDRLSDLAERTPSPSPTDLAKALIDFMLGLQSERTFAMTIVEARGGAGEQRAKFRAALRGGVAAVLRAALPHLTTANARASAIVTLHVLKGVANSVGETPALRRQLMSQYQALLSSYFSAMSGRSQ